MKRVKEVKYKVIEGETRPGGEHTIEYTDVLLQSCTPEVYMLITNVTLINFKK